jgi:hypothetical protein
MTLRLSLATTAFAAGLLFSGASQAATITGSFAAWAAAAGAYTDTSSTGLPLYSTVTTIPLADGTKLSVAGSADTLLQPLDGWGPWSGTYSGDIVDTTTNSETISFGSSVSALGFQVSPDFGLFGPFAETFTVTLSNGQSTQISGSYPAGTTQFIGFTGGGAITAITITTANAPDFAFGNIVDVPEPMSLVLLAGGVGILAAARRRCA